MGDPRVASPIIYKAQLRLAYAAWDRGKAKGRGSVLRELRPHHRSRCAEHGRVVGAFPRVVSAPPEVDMVSPPEVPRNAERAKSQGRAKGRLGVARPRAV